MKIILGSIVQIEDTDEDMKHAMELVCQCGHRLRDHAWTTAYWFPDLDHHTLHPSACVSCKCLDFRIKQ